VCNDNASCPVRSSPLISSDPTTTTTGVAAEKRRCCTGRAASLAEEGKPRLHCNASSTDVDDAGTPPLTLDTWHARAVDLALRGHNLLLIGGSGTGTSQTLRHIVAALRIAAGCGAEGGGRGGSATTTAEQASVTPSKQAQRTTFLKKTKTTSDPAEASGAQSA
jgi:hypothetical protein